MPLFSRSTTEENDAENDTTTETMPEDTSTDDGEAQPIENPTDPDRVYVAYSSASYTTGKHLAQYLGVRYGKAGRMGSPRPDYLIRWGTTSGVTYIPDEGTLNSQTALQRNTDKYQSLVLMDEAGVPVPEFNESFDRLINTEGVTYPVVGRSSNHTQGRDINLILQERDDYLTTNDFFVEYIPTAYEFRVHVFDGEVVKVHEKRLRSQADNHPFIRNSETGWVFVNQRTEVDTSVAVDAVDALDMDFGAVDMVLGEDGNPYVLEVNSAPSLGENNLDRWGPKVAEAVGLEDYPGLEAVEWDDEDDEVEDDTFEFEDDEDYIDL